MKTMKKLASAALALIMTLALAIPAMAAEETGSITVTNAVPEQTYTIYKIFDLSFDGADAYTYTVNSAWAGFIGQTTVDGVYVDVDDQGYVTWVENADPAAFAKLALAYAQDNSIGNQGSEKAPAAAEGETTSTVAFTDLELGYYLIDSSLGALCALDTTNKDASVTEKNEKPTDKKEADPVQGNEPKLGDDKYYTITINAKKGAQAYVVHDTMSASLTFKPSTLTVTATPVVADGETAETKTLTLGTDYILTVPDEGETALDDGCTFEVAFVQAYLDTLAGNTTIKLNYAGTINSNAVIGKDPITNKEILSYGDGNKTDETPGNQTEDNLYEFDIVKTTSNGTKLDGATFTLWDAEEEGNKIDLVKVDGYYRPATAEEKAAEGFTSAIIETTNGMANIKGLGEGTYYLQEESAPAGYNKLKTRQPVSLAADVKANDEATLETVDGREDVQVWGGVQVYNFTGVEMPDTGSIGTTIFYVVGGLLVVGAGVMLITKKRMSGEEE